MASFRYAIYPLCVLLWAFYLVLYPPWIGCSYVQKSQLSEPSSYHLSGTFELDQQLGEINRAPLWNAPNHLRTSMRGTVRWPWQSVNKNNHIELNIGRLVWHFSIGLLTLGLMLGIWHWFSCKYEHHGLVSFQKGNWLMFVIYSIIWLITLLLTIPVLFQGYAWLFDIMIIFLLYLVCMCIGIPLAVVANAWSISITLLVVIVSYSTLVILSRGYLAMSITGNEIVKVLVGAMLFGGVIGWIVQKRRYKHGNVTALK